jgi:UDP-4-amino-4,6-dideoxy-N-acetyl-beta-L-altrosamine transaminase
MIPYGRQEITQKDIDAVVEVLKSDFITQGPKVPEFEQAVADKVTAKHAVAANSATSALHLACRALGVEEGDWVWTSPITFVASANCARYCGAEVDLVDIDPHTYNMSVNALENKLEKAEQAGRLPKLVIPVHLCGQSCEMAAIANLAVRYGFSVIEDASHAIGGYYRNEPIGNCRYSDITVFSFHPVKIITTGEGGMAVTNREDLAERMALLRSHGITRNISPTGNHRAQSLESQAASDLHSEICSLNASTKDMSPAPSYYYEQIDLGYNYRMTDLQAALGLQQLERLDEFVAKRHELAKKYDRKLAGLPVVFPFQHPDTYSALHLYPIRLRLTRIKCTRREVFEELRRQGIGVNVHYIPVHLQPYYQGMGFEPGMFPEAEKYYQEAITLPLFPAITEKQQNKVANALRDAIDLYN